MNTIKTTEFEMFVLNCLARNCYTQANYGRPDEFNDCSGGTWTHSILDADTKDFPEPTGFTKRALPGIVASLVKKGWVTTTEDGKDSTTGLTEDGFKKWQSLFPNCPSTPAERMEATKRYLAPTTDRFVVLGGENGSYRIVIWPKGFGANAICCDVETFEGRNAKTKATCTAARLNKVLAKATK